jgi:hypothetical protein
MQVKIIRIPHSTHFTRLTCRKKQELRTQRARDREREINPVDGMNAKTRMTTCESGEGTKVAARQNGGGRVYSFFPRFDFSSGQCTESVILHELFYLRTRNYVQESVKYPLFRKNPRADNITTIEKPY